MILAEEHEVGSRGKARGSLQIGAEESLSRETVVPKRTSGGGKEVRGVLSVDEIGVEVFAKGGGGKGKGAVPVETDERSCTSRAAQGAPEAGATITRLAEAKPPPVLCEEATRLV